MITLLLSTMALSLLVLAPIPGRQYLAIALCVLFFFTCVAVTTHVILLRVAEFTKYVA